MACGSTRPMSTQSGRAEDDAARQQLLDDGARLLAGYHAPGGAALFGPSLATWCELALLELAAPPIEKRLSRQRVDMVADVWSQVLREVKSRVPHADDCECLAWERSAWYRRAYPQRPECSCGLDAKWARLDARNGQGGLGV